MPEHRHAIRSAVVLLALALVLPLGTPAGGAEGAAGITERFTISNGTVETEKRLEAFDAVALAVFDLDGDGVPEIIAHNDNNRAYVFDGATGALIAELETNIPERWGARELAGAAVGDVSGNGVQDLVLTNSAGWVTVFEARPTADPEQKIEFVKLWERWMDPHKEDPDYKDNMSYGEWKGWPGLDGPPYLADVDGDGRDEIFVQLDDMPGNYALNGDGTVRWWRHWSDGNANPTATDFTGDGAIEVAFATDGGRILFFDGASGEHRCTWDAKAHDAWPASISVAPTVVDVTGDGRKELVFGVRNVEYDPAKHDEDDTSWHEESHAHYFALTADCQLVWHKVFEWGNPHVHMQAVPVDVTGNGQLDILFHDWNTVGHKPGNWEERPHSNLFALEGHSGEPLWRVDTASFWSNKNIAVADVTGDGAPEILVVAPDGAGMDGVKLYDLQGEYRGHIGVGWGWTVARGPAVADTDGDGTMEIIIPVLRPAEGCTRNLDVGCREGALKVFGTTSTTQPAYDNVILFNHRYDHADTPRSAPTPDVTVTQEDAGPDVLRLRVESGTPVEGVQARPAGEAGWTDLTRTGEDVHEMEMPLLDVEDDLRVRVTFHDGRVAYTTLKVETPDRVVVDGRVLDPDGAPVVNATVIVARDGASVGSFRTDEAGAFRFTGPSGAYAFTASKDKYTNVTHEETLDPGATADVTLTIEPLVTDGSPRDIPAGTVMLGSVALALSVAIASIAFGGRRGRQP